MQECDKKTGGDRVIKHLEMIQTVINRLGHDSFLVKGWSMAVLTAGIIFIAREDLELNWLVGTLAIPVIGFWILDGYFLRKERLFREIYNDVRVQESTNFEMDTDKHLSKKKCKWRSVLSSITLGIFYGIELFFIIGALVVMYFVNCV